MLNRLALDRPSSRRRQGDEGDVLPLRRVKKKNSRARRRPRETLRAARGLLQQRALSGQRPRCLQHHTRHHDSRGFGAAAYVPRGHAIYFLRDFAPAPRRVSSRFICRFTSRICSLRAISSAVVSSPSSSVGASAAAAGRWRRDRRRHNRRRPSSTPARSARRRRERRGRRRARRRPMRRQRRAPCAAAAPPRVRPHRGAGSRRSAVRGGATDGRAAARSCWSSPSAAPSGSRAAPDAAMPDAAPAAVRSRADVRAELREGIRAPARGEHPSRRAHVVDRRRRRVEAA